MIEYLLCGGGGGTAPRGGGTAPRGGVRVHGELVGLVSLAKRLGWTRCRAMSMSYRGPNYHRNDLHGIFSLVSDTILRDPAQRRKHLTTTPQLHSYECLNE